MIDAFEDDSYEEELDILESEVRAALKVLGRNESPRGRWDTDRITSSHTD